MKKILKLYILITLMLTSTSCDKFLDVKPVDSLEEDLALINLVDFQQALRGCYSAATSGSYYGGTFYGLTEVPTDNVKRGLGNAGQYQFIYNLNYSSGADEFLGLYQAIYQVIYRVNKILPRIEGMTDATQAQKDIIRAEALMLRALAHHDLVRTFARRYAATGDASHLGVPIKLTAELNFPTRNTVKEVYDQIKVDISVAFPNLPNSTAFGATTFTQRAATALLARVALYENNNVEAINKATEAIGTGAMATLATGTTYTGMWSNDGKGSGEVIFKLAMVQGFSRMGTTFYDRASLNDYFAPASELYDSYALTDARRSAFFTTVTGGKLVIAKHLGTTGLPGLVDIKILRLSELYLIRAEARAKTGNEADALADLNAVRVARGVATGTETGSNLINAIRTEKRKEFAFEAHRWFDLTRENLDIVRGGDCNAVNCSLPNTNFRYTFPIPQQEIRSNPATVQNAGY